MIPGDYTMNVMEKKSLMVMAQQTNRKIRWFSVLPLSLLAFTISLVACEGGTDMGGGTGYNGPRNQCVRDENCPQGRCHAKLSLCAVNHSGSEALYAKVILEGTNIKPQIFSVPMASAEQLVLELATPIPFDLVSAEVDTDSDSDGGSQIDADILFIDRTNSLLNKTPSVEVYKTYLNTMSFFLLPATYDVTIYPVGEDAAVYPVYNMKNIVIQSDGTALQDNLPIEISLPHAEASDYDLLEGHVVYPSSLSEKDYVKDLYVQAFNLSTGEILSKSTQLACVEKNGNTCTKNISIPLFFGTTSVGLRFFKPNEPFYPVYVHEIESLDASKELSIELQRLQKPVLVHGTVEVNNRESGATPPPLCRILFENSDDSERELEYWVETNESGNVERVEGAEGVYLYPGSYKVTAYPIQNNIGNGNKYAPTEFATTLVVTNENVDTEGETDVAVNAFSISLAERLKITGAVEIGDRVVPQANISTFNIETQHPYSKNLTVATRSNGEFDLWLENTIYFVTIQAPSESKYANGNGIWNILKSKSYSFTGRLQIPFVITGQLEVSENPNWNKNIDLNKATIEWYKQFGQNVYLIARSKVNEEGTFSALLPPN